MYVCMHVKDGSTPQVIVENGDLLCGILSKDTLGNKGGSLMHLVFLEKGVEAARDFYGSIQTVVNNYLLLEGHSIGIGDTIADKVTYDEIQKTIRQAKVGTLVVPLFSVNSSSGCWVCSVPVCALCLCGCVHLCRLVGWYRL